MILSINIVATMHVSDQPLSNISPPFHGYRNNIYISWYNTNIIDNGIICKLLTALKYILFWSKYFF